MNFAPKKRRRIDERSDSESLPGPSSRVLPLVAPQLVKKSSKDPNRNMYPKGMTHRRLSSSPQFVKASDIRRPLTYPIKEEAAVSASDASHSNEGVQERSSSDSKSAERSSNIRELTQELNCVKKLFSSSHLVKKRRSKLTHIGAASKITKYFKSVNPPTVQTQTAKTVATKSETETSHTSGWRQKDESLLESLAEINNEQFFKNCRDCYGLVENSAPESDGEDYFSILPTHIIENILCQIPMLDLMACRLVCSRWCEIIDSQRYMEWKKLYYKLKKQDESISPSIEQRIRELLSSLDYNTLEDGLPAIIKYMESGFNHVPSSDMSNLLMQNPKAKLADQVLSERFPGLNGKETRVWCQFTIAILISETVWDILQLYKCLFSVHAACSRADVVDAMYCIAAFLLYFLVYEGINCGLHYRLYYALYLIENHIPKSQSQKLRIIQGLSGQQSMLNYSTLDCSFLTYEQIRILNHQFDMNQKIRIIALAGTGKTTTLLYLSKLYPQIKFLNLVFNKSVSDEAKKKFPQNVTCKTAHSLAFSAVGRFMRHKLTSTLRPYDLISHLKNSNGIQMYTYANLVLSTITNFTLSNATTMDVVHVPTLDLNHKHLSEANQNNILVDARQIWQMMMDTRNPFKITHDVYLKLYHLQQPKLNKYQCIMVDEAQDCNPAILDIVRSQTMPVIFVGDPNQQIYGFRGANNALENISATHTYHLTKSFRFGPEISYMASCILERMLVKNSTTIVGSTNNSYINGKADGQYAIIARTNIMLFNEALRIVVFKRLKANEPSVINAAFAGGINSYGFDQIADIYRLKNTSREDKPITDKFISRFGKYSDLVNYARHSDDSDLLSKIEIVNQHGHDITKFISILKERCNKPIQLANVVFSTVHKSKGLEFDTVYLTDDYPISTFPEYPGGPIRLNVGFIGSNFEESRILYVAVTRAKKYLLLPEKMNKVLHLAYEKFEYPVSSKSLLQDKPALNCVQCNASFTPHTVLMYLKRGIKMASEREIKEGPLCMKCGSDPHVRPDVHINGMTMYLDAIKDNAHRFLSKIVGPLPNDPPIVHDRFAEFQNADRVFVINLNIH